MMKIFEKSDKRAESAWISILREHASLRQAAVCCLLVAMLSLTGQSHAQSGASRLPQAIETGTIRVPLVNIRHLKRGELFVVLYKKVKRVELDLSDAFLVQRAVPAKNKMDFTFEKVDYGEYAVGVFHDLDNDDKLDAIFGFPREDMAVSRNASGGPLGGPKWSAAKFRLNRPNIVLEPLKMYPFGPDD